MFKFNTLTNARNFQNRAVKTTVILLGDDGLFWVCVLADAARLMAQGYELAD